MKKGKELRQLIEQEHAERCRQHPTIPPDYIPRKPYTDRTANGLTQAIIAFITLNGGQAERISTTGRVKMERGKALRCGRVVEILRPTYIPTSGTRGAADISATIGGRSVKIEVKVGRDRQRPDQKQYQDTIERAGGIYYIARDFASFVDWYKRTFNNITL